MIPDRLPPMEVAGRMDRLRARMGAAACDALVVTSTTNIGYLTGFRGSAGLLWVDDTRAVLVTDGRYGEQAPDELHHAGVEAEVEIVGSDHDAAVARLARGVPRIGLEARTVVWAAQRRLVAALDAGEVVPTDGLVESLREVKDHGEVARIEAAAAIADSSLADVWPMLDEEPTERDVAAAIDDGMRRRGATDRAFPTIVATGSNSARPHARPGGRPLRPGDLVVCDLGAVVDGYRSDMTRSTRIGGTGDGREAELLEAVLAAQRVGLDTVADGVPAAEVDAACRETLGDLAEGFIHGTGHGVGLDIHEAPAVSATATATLRAGQVITVEPGVYLAGVGGVRWEDTVVVTESGFRRLTRSPSAI